MKSLRNLMVLVLSIFMFAIAQSVPDQPFEYIVIRSDIPLITQTCELSSDGSCALSSILGVNEENGLYDLKSSSPTEYSLELNPNYVGVEGFSAQPIQINILRTNEVRAQELRNSAGAGFFLSAKSTCTDLSQNLADLAFLCRNYPSSPIFPIVTGGGGCGKCECTPGEPCENSLLSQLRGEQLQFIIELGNRTFSYDLP